MPFVEHAGMTEPREYLNQQYKQQGHQAQGQHLSVQALFHTADIPLDMGFEVVIHCFHCVGAPVVEIEKCDKAHAKSEVSPEQDISCGVVKIPSVNDGNGA